MRRLGLCAVGLMMTMLLFPLERVSAQNVNTTIPVSVTVASACSINGTALNFGSYAGTQLTSTGTITVTCSQDRPYNVTLDRGLNLQGGIRGMRDFNSQTFTVALQYFLYKDSALTQEWGDSGFAGTYTLGTSVSGTGTGSAQTLTIYGKLLADQLGAAPGTYTDTVVATLLF